MTEKTQKTQIVSFLFDYVDQSFTCKEITHELGLPEPSVRRELRDLFKRGLIDQNDDRQYSITFPMAKAYIDWANRQPELRGKHFTVKKIKDKTRVVRVK